MELMKFICPKSPPVWEGKGFSVCFQEMVLGFGANVVTVVVICALAWRSNNVSRNKVRRLLWEKLFFHIVPVLGACLSLFDMFLLLKYGLKGQAIHKWFFRGSQFTAWIIVMLFLKSRNWSVIFFNRVLCFWWIAKTLMEIPHLQTTFFSLGTIRCFKESCSFLMDFIFGLYVNIFRVVRPHTGNRKSNSLEESFLSCDGDPEESYYTDSDEAFPSYWDHLTFKLINPIMDRGVTKQLDFGDLIPLPRECDPSSCIVRC